MVRIVNHKGRPKRRIETPLRWRAARVDAKVGTIVQKIEKEYDLPRGCIKIVNPDGGTARSNKTIKRLLRDYDA